MPKRKAARSAGYAGCKECSGSSGCPAASAGANTCTHRECRDAWALKLAAKRKERKGLPAEDEEPQADAPDDFFCRPADIADECFHVAHQARSTWSNELVIRPFGENW